MAKHKYDKWEAEEDARSLMNSVKVRKDKGRFGRAQKALKTMEAEAKAASLERKVAMGLKKAFPE